MLKKVSLKDVAERAGVSTALVSFVLNGKGDKYRVSTQTSERIKKVAKDMHYMPNLAAKTLRSTQTNTIGVVVSDISNPFFAQISRYIQDEAEKLGYTVLFASSDENSMTLRRVTMNIVNKGVDGLVIVPCKGSYTFIKSLVRQKTPLVLLDRFFKDIDCNYVALNSEKASYDATNYILQKGYKRPSVICFDVKLSYMSERINGYVNAMKDAGLEDYINIITLDEDNARRSAKKLIPKAIEEGADSFFFITNILSESSLYAMLDLDSEVIDRLAIVGFDGSPSFDFFRTPVPYVAQPLEEIAKRAIEILVDNMTSNQSDYVAQHNLIDGVLINGDF